MATKQAAKRKPITWEELSTHCRDDDCWVAVDGKVYDVTSWIPKHPGGQDLIVNCAGRDVTNLFESYHITSDVPAAILKKYYVCDVSTTEHPKYTSTSPFYSTLKQRVAKYFKDNKLDPQVTWKMWARYLSIYCFFIATYYLTHYVIWSSLLTSILVTVLFGWSEVLFSMHMLHDSSHACFTHSPKAWKMMGASFDLCLGASHYAWYHQHILGHHVYTNVRGADPDIGENDPDFRRVSPAQEWRSYYKYQHIYAPILYGLLAFKQRTQDWQNFIFRTNGPIRVLNPPTLDVAIWLCGKLSFIVLRLVLPLFFVPLGRVMLSFFLAEFLLGYYLAFVFQVSHVAHGLDFLATPLPPAPAAKIDEDWAISQLRTTQDYGHGSAFTTFATGALNYQTAHHLFPTINQSHYMQITPLIIETCKEFGIEYKVLPNFWTAFMSHLSYLKFMGQEPKSGMHSDEDSVDGKVKSA